VTRIEAGFILLGIDYFSAPKVVLEARKSTPGEIGLGWIVDFERPKFPNFIGRERSRRRRKQGSRGRWSVSKSPGNRSKPSTRAQPPPSLPRRRGETACRSTTTRACRSAR
jgi:glycine cleavage system aminomethyltransferase T